MFEILLIAVLVAVVAAAVTFAVRARIQAEKRVRLLLTTLGGGPELAASLDVDEVVGHALDAAVELPGVDAVVVDADGIHAVRGASEEEVARAALETPPNRNLRALEVVFRYRLDEADRAASLLRAGLVVPLAARGQAFGSINAYTRSPSHSFPPETVASLERLAARAGPALDNARRFGEARRLADVDSLTGLKNRRRFHELLASELDRARRYERKLSLIVFDLDNFKRINDRLGHLTGDAVLAEVASRVKAVVRSSDIACRVGGDEFAVIMPETSLQDAEALANRIARTVAERPIGGGHKLYVSAGVAALRESDDPSELFERADEALYRAKQAGKSRTIAAG